MFIVEKRESRGRSFLHSIDINTNQPEWTDDYETAALMDQESAMEVIMEVRKSGQFDPNIHELGLVLWDTLDHGTGGR